MDSLKLKLMYYWQLKGSASQETLQPLQNKVHIQGPKEGS